MAMKTRSAGQLFRRAATLTAVELDVTEETFRAPFRPPR